MSTKQTPKSCSCQSCKRGKGTDAGHKAMTYDERCFRRKSKQLLKKGQDENISPVPIGHYYD